MDESLSCEVRPALTRDSAACCDVLRRSITELCATDYEDVPGFVGFWLENKTPENVKRWIDTPFCYCAAAWRLGVVVGFGAVSVNAEILLCYVLPEVKGRGIVHALLGHLEAWASKRGHRRFHVVSTVTARGFYERKGYRLSGPPLEQADQIVELPMVKAFA